MRMRDYGSRFSLWQTVCAWLRAPCVAMAVLALPSVEVPDRSLGPPI